MFSMSADRGFRDRHLWLSLMFRPALSNFTRSQRLACCLLMATGWLWAAVVLRGTKPSSAEEASDPFEPQGSVIVIGILCVLIMLPFGIVATALFRKSQPHRPSGYLNEWFVVPSKEVATTDDNYGVDPKAQSSVTTCRSDVITFESTVTGNTSNLISSYESFSSGSPAPNRRSFQTPLSASEGSQISANTFSSAMGSDTDDFKLPRFPKWTVYIAWGLVITLCVFFSGFIIVFSLRFSTIRMVYCLGSLLVSAFLGIVVAETLAVLFFASFYVYKHQKVDELYISKTDILTDRCIQDLERVELYHSAYINEIRRGPHYQPPSYGFLVSTKALYRAYVNEKLLDATFCATFLFLALLVAMYRRDHNTFVANDFYNRVLFKERSFQQIRSRDDFWQWTDLKMLDVIYSRNENLTSVMGNEISILLKPPRMVRFLNKTVDPYKFNYRDNIEPDNERELGTTKSEARTVLEDLQKTNWLNKREGSAMLEIMGYSSDLDLFTLIVVVIELPKLGGAFVTSHVQTLLFHEYHQYPDWVAILLDALFAFVVVAYTVYIVRKMWKLGVLSYFFSFWHILDFFIVFLAWCMIVVDLSFSSILAHTVDTYHTSRVVHFQYLITVYLWRSCFFGLTVFVMLLRCFQFLEMFSVFNRFLIVLGYVARYILFVVILLVMQFFVIASFMYLVSGCYHSEFLDLEVSMLNVLLGINVVISNVFHGMDEKGYSEFDWALLLFLFFLLVVNFITLSFTFAIFYNTFVEFFPKHPYIERLPMLLKEYIAKHLKIGGKEKRKRSSDGK